MYIKLIEEVNKMLRDKFSINIKLLLSIILLFIFSFSITDVKGTEIITKKVFRNTGVNFQIKGKISDAADGTAIENVKISILDSKTRTLLYDNIYTNADGSYSASINLALTSIESNSNKLPLAYYVSNSYPNPVSLSKNTKVFIQYSSPNNSNRKPKLELFNILGKRLDARSNLAAGVYIFRLKFDNGYLSESKKIVLSSNGHINFSLQPIQLTPNKRYTKTQFSNNNVSTDSVKVLIVMNKVEYAYMERVINLKSGIDNINNYSLVKAGNQRSAIIDSTGGSITVSNAVGDSITLIIPPYNIWNSTTITLTAFDTPPETPIAKNILPGVSITPAGLKLTQPAILKVKFINDITDTSIAMLFLINQSDYVIPLGHLKLTKNSIAGEIYHFSDYFAGEPSRGETDGQSTKGSGESGDEFTNWNDTFTEIGGLLSWAEELMAMGDDEEAQRVTDRAKEILDKAAKNFLNLPVPDEPCGWYKNQLIKFAEAVFTMIGDDLGNQYSTRVQEIWNRCAIRGCIQCDYAISLDAGPTPNWFITGSIPFHSLNTDYLSVTGEGTLTQKIYSQTDCLVTGSGSNQVVMDGKVTADNQGYLWLEIDWTENWNTTNSWTMTCPDGPPVTGSEPPWTEKFHLRFLAVEGYQIMQPGPYKWTLHLFSMP